MFTLRPALIASTLMAALVTTTFTGAVASSATAAPAPAPSAAAPAAVHLAPMAVNTVLFEYGDTSRRVRIIQARLRQIEWFFGDVTDYFGSKTLAAVRGFQAKRGLPVTGKVDTRTLERLKAMTRKPTRAELANRAPMPGAGAALDRRCKTGRVLCVDKTSRSLRWVVDGDVKLRFAARFGAASTPTREGQFSVYYKNRDHVSSLYGSAMPFAMFFSGGQAVHYSADFASVGYAGASHGCVNIRDYAKLAKLYERVRIGDKVVVYRS